MKYKCIIGRFLFVSDDFMQNLNKIIFQIKPILVLYDLSYYPKHPNKDHFWLREILDLKQLSKRYKEANFKLKFYYSQLEIL